MLCHEIPGTPLGFHGLLQAFQCLEYFICPENTITSLPGYFVHNAGPDQSVNVILSNRKTDS